MLRSAFGHFNPSDRVIAKLGLDHFARRSQEAGGDGGVGPGLDQDKRAGESIGRVPIEIEGLGGVQANSPKIIHG